MAPGARPPRTAPGTSRDSSRLFPALGLLVLATLATYWPVLSNGFIDYDDPDYVTANMMVRQGLTLKGIVWAFTAFHAANWHPLTWISHMLDVTLFGMNPAGHHAVSLLLHTLNGVLVCTLLYRMTGLLGRSLTVALLFALHPLHVESVAWVAERKDLLSTLFWLLTMHAYAGYVKKAGLWRYGLVALLFALGLMAKQMLVTLPLMLLVMDYWPLRRVAGTAGPLPTPFMALLREKIPLFLIAAAASLVTIRAQGAGGAMGHGGESASLLLSAGNALLAYVTYIRKMLWPSDLAFFYPLDPAAVTIPALLGAIALLAATTACTVALRRTRPWLLSGWLWYLITLLPVIGFIRIGDQALADRYTYIPLTGLFVMICWGGAELVAKWRGGHRYVAGITLIVCAFLAILTTMQLRYWQSSFALYRHALETVEGNWLAHNNMGTLLLRQRRNDEAIAHFRESVRLNPRGVLGLKNLGNALMAGGRYAEAIDAFRTGAMVAPDDAEVHFLLGITCLQTGNSELARREYQQLLRLDQARAASLLELMQAMGRR
jgi:tetratricopeptide (TPR) repeat protein